MHSYKRKLQPIERRVYLASIPAALIGQGDQFLGLIAPEDQKKVAILFARQIWNTCPIPANDYHRAPFYGDNKNYPE